ncbi:hypothetical protein WJX72_012122 [[Myrmecia] bisecta]|uniref:Peptidase M20 dimerisation domain-containing protein n=1 Tax=[Myrmecia] bisecta TaxID=41462 RepID=A0AAW1PDI6_9CHLO
MQSLFFTGEEHGVLQRLAILLDVPATGLGTRVLYQAASKAAFSTREFHRLCDGQGPTIVLLRKEGSQRCYGGFTSVSWSSSSETVLDEHAFMFSFSLAEPAAAVQKYKQLEPTGVMHSRRFGPSFGSGISPDFSIRPTGGRGDWGQFYHPATYALPASFRALAGISGDYTAERELEVLGITEPCHFPRATLPVPDASWSHQAYEDLLASVTSYTPPTSLSKVNILLFGGVGAESATDDAYMARLKELKELARVRGIPTLVWLTKIDVADPDLIADLTLTYRSPRIIRLIKEVAALSGAGCTNDVFCVKAYSHEQDPDYKVGILLFRALQHALFAATDFLQDIQPRMVREQFLLAGCLALGVGLLYQLRDEPADLQTFSAVEVLFQGEADAAEQLAGLLQLRTVSNAQAEKHVNDPQALVNAHGYLKKTFPLVWKRLDVETVGDLSLLLRWKGSDPSLQPLLCVSHLDVVPADNPEEWSEGPFSGSIKDGFIWGRGAMDVKVTVTALLEAVNQLLKDRFSPARTVYLAFGHDEEVGGQQGAGQIAALLQSRGIQLEYVFDEGGILAVDGFPPLTTSPVALVGTAEKGIATVAIEVRSKGGHSSAPPLDGSSVGATLARIISHVDQNPPSAKLVRPVNEFLQAFAPHAPHKALRILLRYVDSWLLAPLAARVLVQNSAETAAFVRTTAAPTRLQAGVADNVLPQAGVVSYNFRLLPGDPPEAAVAYLHQVVASSNADATITANTAEARNASYVSSTQTTLYKLISQAAHEVLAPGQELVVAPFLLVGATDSRHYANMTTGGVYRFVPLPVDVQAGDLKRIHGTNERVEVAGYIRAIKFYIRVLRLASTPGH